jgi:hypothetical protein
MDMKALYANLLVAGLLVVVGCNTGPTGGKPGEPGGTFKLDAPSSTPETKVKQGETVIKDVTVKPETNFKDDIAFTASVEPADKDVAATLEPKAWKASDPKPVKVHIKAGDKAAPGEYTIHVKGAPTKGNPSDATFKIKVEKK